ncbi:MAG: hypothetical protein WC836_23185, partial [Desulfobacula sp.]
IISETVDSDFKKILTNLNLLGEKDSSEEERGDWAKKRKWLLDTLIDILRNGKDEIPKGFLLSHQLSLDPGFINDAFSIMKTFFRDLMIFDILPEKIVNLDFFDSFSDISHMTHKERCFDWLKCLYNAEKKLEANCTLRLILDSFFLMIAENKREVRV